MCVAVMDNVGVNGITEEQWIIGYESGSVLSEVEGFMEKGFPDKKGMSVAVRPFWEIKDELL